jgi:2-C-methyl-D-erythritol 4-phosphate cytidylyltransferase
MEAYLQAGAEATDDASLVEALGHPVRLFPGSPSNIKVTTAYDLALARALLTTGEVVP